MQHFYIHFYPRSPRGERPREWGDLGAGLYFYPRSPRGERLLGHLQPLPADVISIHAPREGSDLPAASPGCGQSINFYPRSPRGERRCGCLARILDDRFLSTLPARGATGIDQPAGNIPLNFYPRSPRGERPSWNTASPWSTNFYPRSPRGERRRQPDAGPCHRHISIHAPREGSDPSPAVCRC